MMAEQTELTRDVREWIFMLDDNRMFVTLAQLEASSAVSTVSGVLWVSDDAFTS